MPASVTGPGHISQGLPNQDSVITRAWKGQWMVAVCDGMGSRKHAQFGSRTAVLAALKAVKTLNFESDDRTIVTELYRFWLEGLSRSGVTPADAVTTCVLIWGRSSGEFRYAHIGDGAIFSGVNVLSQDLNTGSFSNQTTGLGASKKLSDWRFGRNHMRWCGSALAVATDGVTEDLTAPDLFCDFISGKLKKMSVRQGRNWLGKQLENWPTPGHSDDKSICFVLPDRESNL